MRNKQPLKRVVLACDEHLHYAFLLPIAARFWRRAGYSPLVFLVGTRTRWEKLNALKIVFDELESAEVHIVPPVGFLTSANTARIVRLFAACIDVNGYLLTADVDILPIDVDWFTREYEAGTVDLYDADCNAWGQYGPLPRYNMNYIGAGVAEWREIMQYSMGEPHQVMMLDLQTFLGKKHNPISEMHYDERRVSAAIEAWSGKKNPILREGMSPHCYPRRSYVSREAGDHIDAVLPINAPGWRGETLSYIHGLYRDTINDGWFDEYKDRFGRVLP